jgi:hypothetical protein
VIEVEDHHALEHQIPAAMYEIVRTCDLVAKVLKGTTP